MTRNRNAGRRPGSHPAITITEITDDNRDAIMEKMMALIAGGNEWGASPEFMRMMSAAAPAPKAKP